MFSFLKRSSLKTALESYQKNSRIGQALTPEQFEMVIDTSLFKDIDSRYKAIGLTNWGALAWLSGQCVINTLKVKEGDEDVSTLLYEMTEKMAYVSFFIFNNIPELKLTKKDMIPIENAGRAASQWVDWLKEEDPSFRQLMDMMGRD